MNRYCILYVLAFFLLWIFPTINNCVSAKSVCIEKLSQHNSQDNAIDMGISIGDYNDYLSNKLNLFLCNYEYVQKYYCYYKLSKKIKFYKIFLQPPRL